VIKLTALMALGYAGYRYYRNSVLENKRRSLVTNPCADGGGPNLQSAWVSPPFGRQRDHAV
jgi:hypothetical protein